MQLEETELQKEKEENRLGTMDIGPLLVKMSVPILISMLVQALYNVVDSVFVGYYSKDAFTAVSLAFPVQNLIIAVAVGTAVGVNSLLSRRLGEKQFESANKVACNGLFLAMISWLVFAAGGLLFSDLFFAKYDTMITQGESIATMGASYMRIVTVGSVGVFGQVMFERLLQSTGRSFFSMISQLAGALINIILDPIMIFGLLGFPRLGVAGAAYATVIGQIGGMCIGMYFNQRHNHDIQVRFKGFSPNRQTIGHIYQVGLPSIIMMSIGSVMVWGMNEILRIYHEAAIWVLGAYFKLQSFIFMPVFGFNSGMVPIIAYNYGAKRPARITKAVRYGLVIGFSIMVAGTALFWIKPEWMLSIFHAPEEMILLGVPALRIISLAFPMASIGIIFSGVFQALGKGMYSLLMSIVRQLVFLLPMAWILIHWWGLPAVWFSIPIAEVFSLFLALFLYRRVYNRQIKPLQEKAD